MSQPENVAVRLNTDIPCEHFGTILEWHITVGDWISRDGDLVDVEVEKTTLTVTAPTAGVVMEIIPQVNEEGAEGAVLCRIAP